MICPDLQRKLNVCQTADPHGVEFNFQQVLLGIA